jgi:hypothetical protein
MVTAAELPVLEDGAITGHRLVNSRFPPISLFDDVASEDELEVAYALQALVNPRIQTEIGNLSLLRRDEIPFGIQGCSYATAPFTHVNPSGSRFSAGSFGVLYLADTPETAIAEVVHHQQTYWNNVPGLKFDRLVFRGLVADFGCAGLHDASVLPANDPIYAPASYAASQALGRELHAIGSPGLQYRSVRNAGATCWGLLTPANVTRVIQTAHYEMIWTAPGTDVQVCKISGV